MHKLYYLVIFLTGCCSLIYQVVWQKYLHILVGSEARSTTIIVAIFLSGLSLGYYYFGRLSLKYTERFKFLKMYGYVEIITGAYAICFPMFFTWIDASVLASHPSLLSDFFIGMLLIFPPTVLMGATIPVMTTVLPARNDAVNRGHAIIYGLNTIGAFAGVILASFVLVVHFGLAGTLMFAGFVNVLCGIVYGANRLVGSIHKSEEIPVINSNYTTRDVYLMAFVSGLVSISLEIIWIRLLGLTIGSSFIVFPIVLSLFVLGLGIGSLTVTEVKPGLLRRQFYMMLGCLILSFLLVPYLPLWINNVRVLLVSHTIAYYVFYAAVYVIMGGLLLSFLIPMGKVLPMAYAFLEKDTEKYGFKCGLLYFINSAGTLLGAILFSYLFLYLISIEVVYKINIGIAIFMFLLLLYRDRQYKPIFASALVFILFCVGAEWNRKFHLTGLFRNRMPSQYNFQGVFNLGSPLHNDKDSVPFFQDGPNTTVGVVKRSRSYSNGDKIDYKSIYVNGKSDSSTFGDYSTLTLSAYLPYIHSNPDKPLRGAIVGQGTGVTAGILAQFQDVKQVDLIEISQAVVDALPFFGEYTYNVHTNPKVKIHQLDAFKYFRREREKYDIIISEPTNPWVVGVENLFTPYFYSLIKTNLHDGGVLAQWLHLYAMDDAILSTVFHNVLQVFQHAEVYQVRSGDLLILTSDQPLRASTYMKRSREPISQTIFERVNFKDAESYKLLHRLTTDQLRYIASSPSRFHHTLQNPVLSIKAFKTFFLGSRVNINALIEPQVARLMHREDTDRLHPVLDKHAQYYQPDNNDCITEHTGIYYDTFCKLMLKYIQQYMNYKSHPNLHVRLKGYAFLRKAGIIPKDETFLHRIRTTVEKNLKENSLPVLFSLVTEYLHEGEFRTSVELINNSSNQQMINAKRHQQSIEEIQEVAQLQAKTKLALNHLHAQH